MLMFNASGLLVPVSPILSSLEEVRNLLVFNPKRVQIWEAYIQYFSELKNVCKSETLHQWINGSFVTKKINPGDIDLVTFIDYRIVAQYEKDLKAFAYPNVMSELVDAYIVVTYPETHRNSFIALSDKAYWNDNFTKTRRTRGNRLSKGFIEVFV